MCKHILNAQVSIRAPCCKQWFDCAECHGETADHKLKKHFEMVFACKKCKKAFRKDTTDFDEADEYCPHCDNKYVIPALTQKPKIEPIIEPDVDFRKDNSMLMDMRMKQSLDDQLKDFDYSELLG